MTDDSSSASARYFDDLAVRWDGLMPLDDKSRAGIEAGLASLGVRPGDTVLDAGCGTGVLFPFLLPLVGPGGKVVGVDVSAAMIDEARRKFPARNLRLAVGDVARFLETEPAASLGAIACFQAIPHFPDKRRVLEGFRRLLVPGGRFIVLHFDSSSDLNAFHATLPAPVNAHRLPPVGELKAWALAAGFTVLDAREEPGLYRLVGEKKEKKEKKNYG